MRSRSPNIFIFLSAGDSSRLAGNYGEASALELFGPQYNLQPVIGGFSFHDRGIASPPSGTAVALGMGLCRDFPGGWDRFGPAYQRFG